MDLRSLNIFIEVAELGSFTRAGEKLGYSQPTISFQIKQLEKEMGAQLFDRIGHTVSLTDAGRDALVYAQQICHSCQEMVLGTAGRREPAGVLRLGMADSLCEPLIVGHFAQFRAAYPQVRLHITTLDTSALLESLDRNDVDMICTMDDHVYDTNYVIADEEEIGVHFVASPRHPLSALPSLPLPPWLPSWGSASLLAFPASLAVSDEELPSSFFEGSEPSPLPGFSAEGEGSRTGRLFIRSSSRSVRDWARSLT